MAVSHVDLALAERRDARQIWREAGGSVRRPLYTFTTEQERAEKRAALRELREAARAYVASSEGSAALERSRELNPHLSEANAAIVAYALPGKIVGSCAHWRRMGAKVRKGERAALYIGGGPHVKFAPVAAFTATQTSASEQLGALEDSGGGSSDDIPF